MINFGNSFIRQNVSWEQFKSLVNKKLLQMQYDETSELYEIFAVDDFIIYLTTIFKDSVPYTCAITQEQNNSDLADFENNHKSMANCSLSLKASDGRALIRADSRPRGYTTNFISRGDSATNLGDGKIMSWDFSNSDDEVTDSITTAIPSGFKRKRIEIGFSEKIYIKEGTMYFFGAPKGQYLDMYVVCLTGGYYQDPNGTIPASALGLPGTDMYTQATAPTPIIHYVNHHHMQGDCPMGDELNTEGASESSLPTQQMGYQIWIEVTTPDSDNTSNGCTEMEVYRQRTILLPGESL